MTRSVEITALTQELNIDVLTLSETWFSDQKGIEIQDYSLIILDNATDTKLGKWGGVAIYVRNELKEYVREKPIKKPENINVQIAAIEIADYTVVTCYRPCRQTKEDFEKMTILFEENFKKAKNLIVTGDMNLPGIDWTNSTSSSGQEEEELMETILALGFSQIVEESTHKKGNILDIVLVTEKEDITRIEVLNTKEMIGKNKKSQESPFTFHLNIHLSSPTLERFHLFYIFKSTFLIFN